MKNDRVLFIARIRERIICRQGDETLVLDFSTQDKEMMVGGGLDPKKDEDVLAFINHLMPHRPFATCRNAGGSPPQGWPDEEELIAEWAKNEGIDGSI